MGSDYFASPKEEQGRLGNQEIESVMDGASNESADYQHIEKAQAALDGW